MKINSSYSDPVYRKILNASPDYVSKLVGSSFLVCEVHDAQDSPAVAWTYWDEKLEAWKVCFREEAATLSKGALRALWRHEVGHIALAHFSKETCTPDDPIRSNVEQLQVGDIQVNTYLLDDVHTLEEVGRLANSLYREEGDEEGPGFLDPREILPDIGLKVQEYPYDVIHSYLHQKMDEEAEKNGQNPNWTQGMADALKGMCGGIEAPEDGTGIMEAVSSVVAGVSGNEDGTNPGGEKWGNTNSLGKIRLPENELPKWIGPLESFARSIVEVILADKRAHTRPQPVYEAHGVHIPTQRPRWDYAPATVVFCVDTSGSMMGDLKYVAPVISYLAQHNIKTRLIAGDVRVTFDELVDKVPDGLVGGGGTDIVPIIERAYEYDPESVIIFTDGWVPSWDKDRGVPVLWVGVHETPPYGTAVSANGEKVR
jgi:hypothetical protein